MFAVDLVALGSLGEVFREQELQQGEHVMDVVEMIHSLTAMYERLEEEKSLLVNIPLCVDMCLNWLLNVYDRWVSRRPGGGRAWRRGRGCFTEHSGFDGEM